MDRVDDLGVVDPAQVRGGDPEVGMPELALYDQERDPLAGHLDRMRMPQLVGREPAANSGSERGAVQLGTDRGRGARPAAGRAAQNAEQGADRQGPAQLEPRVELLPRPAVHPDLSPATALSGTDQHGTALAVKIGLSQRQRLADPADRRARAR
jgi:hypothetical protein